MKTITIRLAGPLQSYGINSTFLVRTTSMFPSKSAVLGMIAAAFGYRRDDRRIEQFNDLLFATRADQVGAVMTDYQVVEYKPGKNKLTYRDYLQDSVFMVAVGGDEQLIDQISYALKHPAFQLALGRRSNCPAGVLKIEEFLNQTPLEVLKTLPWQASTWYQKKCKRQSEILTEIYADQILDDKNKSIDTFMQRDLVGSFSEKHRFHNNRLVASLSVNLKNPCFEEKTPEHDIFSAI
ncbi:crispr-associated protein [Lactobacillus pasteurii DSM 23907 = CRBIP 24.76]|uniref:CRISPR system CASCADE complex protein CasD n=1 Tax=Lactobacillus pasteurii DSM 23907 = CRBIP 24.76 TaxID=1423790 RepID=I7J150_9LACO|nr:type I-E CRISPR-associated protein Cas5/CasD [Lactobacillus pasteurii]KRK07372.1 crispr-associated protein [Lactobacillus pasteurii DSM 23907 = CRBIP 24.76]TDG77800.1 hypothetical protein C5L33_000024 [Lactobacillus pasteurii]CCI86097.1 CRISPR system CASCADE complex protein CasD [Lactobacillus pasteurii DSM 23907 = CRBIP 24.76]